MKVLFYSIKSFEIPFLQAAAGSFSMVQVADRLTIATASMASECDVISIFTSDDASAPVLEKLNHSGIRLIALRDSGYDNVDLEAARRLGIAVVHVPGSSPYAVAEYAITLMMALNRKILIAEKNIHRQNFLLDQLVGFDLHGKTVGIIGAGHIGGVLARILHGFGCQLLAFDTHFNADLVQQYNVCYVPLLDLCRRSDAISIHLPLTPKTHYIIDKTLIRQMKKGVLLINTARGGIVDTGAVLDGLNYGNIEGYGADVYEKEAGIFFNDHRHHMLNDPILKQLLEHPRVILTPHQGFATKEALQDIAKATFHNISCWQQGINSGNELVTIPKQLLPTQGVSSRPPAANTL
ncbi:MAG: NAD(P)-dependent oxidoreductase [Flavisolibacter sp.]